jgi:hypothetical protein
MSEDDIANRRIVYEDNVKANKHEWLRKNSGRRQLSDNGILLFKIGKK